MNISRSFYLMEILALAAILLTFLPAVLFAEDSSKINYEVLSPWGEVDPRTLKGISPRLDNLSGKKIGLFANYKRAALPIAGYLQKHLESMYPDIKVSIFHSDQWNVTEIETERSGLFRKWADGNDAVILLVGD